MNRTEIKQLIKDRIMELENMVSKDIYQLEQTKEVERVRGLAAEFKFIELINSQCIEEVRQAEFKEKLEESGIEGEIDQLKEEIESYKIDTEDEITEKDLTDIIEEIERKIESPEGITSIYDFIQYIKKYICSELKIKEWKNKREIYEYIKNTQMNKLIELDKELEKNRVNNKCIKCNNME